MNADRNRTDDLLALALEATSDGIWTWHLPTGDTFFSPRYYTMLGYDPHELPPTFETWASLVHPEDLEPTQQVIMKRIRGQHDTYETEFRMRTKSGDWLWILGRGKVVERDENGRPVRVVGSHVNIDSRRRAEERLARYRDDLEERVRDRTRKLEETSSLLEATFNAIPDVLGVQDNQHRIIRYNQAGYTFLDLDIEDVQGKRCFELIGRTKECEICATSECYRTKEPAVRTRYEEALDAWLDVRAYPILDEDGNLVRVIEHLRDITAEKKAEEKNRELRDELQQAQKMESLGTLAGGIAHDFNNLLMGIQGRASLLAIELARSGGPAEHVEAIEGYVRSAADLTRQLLGFARRGKYEVKPIDVNELIAATAKMFARTHKGLTIRTEIHPEPLIVSADRSQIERVLLNMCINGWQAMPDGGDLRLETGLVRIDESVESVPQIAPGQYCRVRITDTGVGMDEITRRRAFDPFFTTKEKGRGTGLGLASAYGIVTNHGGTITVESREGKGSTFSILLPVTPDRVAQGQEKPTGLTGGTEAILLIDDEQMILDVGREMLEHLGYRVIVAHGGAAGVGILDRRDTPLDLVILDLVMPGMGGGRVFDRIEAIRPGLPVLLSSGFSIGGEAEDLLERGCRGFIQKPFTLADLAQRVRQILDSDDHEATPP
jgi:two-component system cell cycle sensor histidine kinase/response regulator CckA